MRWTTAAIVALCLLLPVLSSTGAATANEPPLPDAGLDQSVERGATVHLDANGSRDPDGDVRRVEWTIRTPGGATRAPDCPTCVQTAFTPTELGRYNVTVAVTDDNGTTRSDTLYVTVTDPRGPTVSLSSPTALPVGAQRNLSATVTAGDASLRSLAWLVNGSMVRRAQLSGDNATATHPWTFNTTGPISVRAVVYDAAGHRGAANQTVRVVSSTGGGGGGVGSEPCPGGTINYYDSSNQNRGCTTGASMTIGDTVVDVDGKPGIWMYVDNELTQVVKPEEADSLSKNGLGETFTKETIDEESRSLLNQRQQRETDNRDSDSDSSPDFIFHEETDSNGKADVRNTPSNGVGGCETCDGGTDDTSGGNDSPVYGGWGP
ncbi:PKD domain-containing protein [Haloarcula salina]|uniref:PKD domain-containing protein n=1 Tax=Haloarcula salina TaxID=1429914 RepID=A0AA41G3H5_9EURY|nr:PKD domain-containing protein [Haloarcula salina]MBV0903650.1 PKD domain-containing protein [Haloarcula salina]